jgi:hypothetical protein
MDLRPVSAAAFAALLLACSTDQPTGLDITRNAGGSAASDTSAAGFPASVRVTGQILGVSATAPVADRADTLHFRPVAGARVTIKRNILVNGRSAPEAAATLDADRDGRFGLELRGGYYVVEADAPGSGFAAGWEYLPATRSSVDLAVYMWKEPD